MQRRDSSPLGPREARRSCHDACHEHHPHQRTWRRTRGGRPGHERRRRREAHPRAHQRPAAPARPVPDARCVRHRQPGRLHRRLPRPPAPRLRDRDLHDRRAHAAPRLGRQRGPAHQRRRAVDDRRPRRDPQRDARAGRRPHGGLSAVAEPRRARQDAAGRLPRHPEHRNPRAAPEGCDRARDRRHQPWHVRRDAPRAHRAAAARHPPRCERELPPAAAAGTQRLRLRLPRRPHDRRAPGRRAAHGDPGQHAGQRRCGAACRRPSRRVRCWWPAAHCASRSRSTARS